MDGISAAGSVAGVAVAGVQLSKCLYDMCAIVKASAKEIQDIANNVSLLSMVLEELDSVICQDDLHYKPQLQQAAQTIVVRCAEIFQDIRKHTGTEQGPRGKKLSERIAWYFRRERVKPLRMSLESLKSTLNILLHVVQLAKTTNNVEEYPGVKPIGTWYMRKERRGLICLVIDNRHAVDKLVSFEKRPPQATESTIEEDEDEEEEQISFADLFPLSPGNSTKRGNSPERKFVVSFSSRAPQHSFHHDLDQYRGRSRHDLAPSIDRHPVVYSPSVPTYTPQASLDPATSRLILDVIPHEEADMTIGFGQNMAGSVVLEAKAEETVDTLMRRWTNVSSKYFTDDDQSLASSTENLPSFNMNLSALQSPAADQYFAQTRKLSKAKHLGSRKPSRAKDSGSTRGFMEEQMHGTNDRIEDMSSMFRERKYRLRKDSSEFPTAQWATDTRPAPTDSGYQSAQTSAGLTSPYSFDNVRQCPNCHPTPLSDPSVGRLSDPQPSVSNAEASGTRGIYSTNRASEGVDRLSNLLNRPSLNASNLKGQTPAVEQILQSNETSKSPQSINSTDADVGRSGELESGNSKQSEEAVKLKDCLGRTFILPIQTCRTWPDMEHLIRRCFSRVESMNLRIISGEYNILSPSGDIILPEIWSAVIQPGWVVELRFCSSQSHPHQSEGPHVTKPAATSGIQPTLFSDTGFERPKRRSLAWIPGRRAHADRVSHSGH